MSNAATVETTHSLTMQVADGVTQIATLQCSYVPGKRVNTSLLLHPAYQAEKHRGQVEAALGSFRAEVLKRLAAEDMPIPPIN